MHPLSLIPLTPQIYGCHRWEQTTLLCIYGALHVPEGCPVPSQCIYPGFRFPGTFVRTSINPNCLILQITELQLPEVKEATITSSTRE